MRLGITLTLATLLAGCTLSGTPGHRSADGSARGEDSSNGGRVRSGDDSETDPFFDLVDPINALPEQPAVVYLRGRTSTGGSSCTGTLIHTPKTSNRRVILTAKHCFDREWDTIYAFVGEGLPVSTKTYPRGEKPYWLRRKVVARYPLADGSTADSNIRDYPSTEGGYPFSDLALLLLEEDMPEEVVPMEISRQAPDADAECSAVGYGNRGGWNGWQRPVTIDRTLVDDYNLKGRSADPTDPTSLTGKGDSGGPLLCNVNGHPRQVGVTSAGMHYLATGNTVTQAPAWYARVDIVYDIIEKVLLAVDSGGTPDANDVPRQSAPPSPEGVDAGAGPTSSIRR